jgi:hypothetical protein
MGWRILVIRQPMLKHVYFDSDMSKSTNTVVYFDWNTVIYICLCGKCRTQFMLLCSLIRHSRKKLNTFSHSKPQAQPGLSFNSNITSFFRFVNKRASYPFGIILIAHAPVNVTYFFIGSINCNSNNADRGRSNTFWLP